MCAGCAALQDAERVIDVLKAALASAGLESVPAFAPWMRDLSAQERALVGTLYARADVLNREQILECLPGQKHPWDRTEGVVDTVISRVRKVLGRDAIETVPSFGWRLSDAFRAEMKKDQLT